MKGRLHVAALVTAGVLSAHPASAAGETVYFGDVFPLKASALEPVFIDERIVEERGDVLVSTHVTRDRDGATVIRESATHSADYTLVEYRLYANQLGESGTIRVEGDQVSFERIEGTERHVRTERVDGPVLVGPTLVGYIVRHLDSLQAGQELGVRLAVLDRLATYGFKLEAVESGAGQVRIRMKPSSIFIAMLVDALYFTFERATGKPVRLEGRVPPKIRDDEGWHHLDARVEYRLVADAYR